MFLVCQKEESVWRAFEAVCKRAERDKKFAKLVAEKSRRVLAAKKKSRALKSPHARRSNAENGGAPDAARSGKFSEELRAYTPGQSTKATCRDRRRRHERHLGRRNQRRAGAHSGPRFPLPPGAAGALRVSLSCRGASGYAGSHECKPASVADLSRLNFLLGELYADAVRTAQRRARLECELVGCHGQTLYHQGRRRRSWAAAIACTWQAGEAAIIAAKLGVPVVSDFRPADMAAGGKGAPLVPFLDYVLYRHRRYGRIVQNLGGIANLTAIPPRADS